MWDPVLDRLADDRDVIAIDMPGFGDSPPLAATAAPHGAVPWRDDTVVSGQGARATPKLLARAIHAHLLALGLERPHVAGNSLGGWVALELALAGHARSVTAIAPAGLWAQPLMPRRSTARLVARALRPVLPALLRSERGKRAALGATLAHPERVPFDAALALVRSYASAPGFEAANAGMRSGRFDGLERIRVPLTLAWPELDRLVARPRNVPAAAREFVLRGCGHMPTWDDPAQVAGVLRAGSQSPAP
jgi:pimeloyl-ACP methyl ester carboxylesterase